MLHHYKLNIHVQLFFILLTYTISYQLNKKSCKFIKKFDTTTYQFRLLSKNKFDYL